MVSKTASPTIMHFAVVLVILFRISFGFLLNFGLDQIFHGLTGGKGELFDFGKFEGSKSIKSGGKIQADKAHDSSFTTNSPSPGNSKTNADSNSGILEDTITSLDTIGGKDGSVLNGTIGAVAGEAGKEERVSEDSLIRSVQKSDEILNDGSLENLLETVAEKENMSKSDSTLGYALEALTETADGAEQDGNLKDVWGIVVGKEAKSINSSIIEGFVKEIAERVSKAVSASIFEEFLKFVAQNAGGSVSDGLMEDTLRTAVGNANETVSSTTLEGSLASVEKIGGVVESSNLEDSLKTTSEKADGAVGEIASKVPLETLSGKLLAAESSSDVESSLGGSLETVAKKVNGVQGINLQDSLETTSGKASGAVGGIVSTVSLQNVSRQARKVPLENVSGQASETVSSSVQESSLSPSQTVITDVTIGETCNSKSDATSFHSVPAVSKFIQVFMQGVHSSELLTILFNITDATPLEFSLAQQRYIADAYRKIGLIQANDIAAFAVRPITKHFDIIIPKVLERVFANTFANHFFAEGFLTHDNAEQLALVYLAALEKSAENNGVSCDCDYNRNFIAIGDGIFDFLLYIGEPSSPQAWEIAFYYAHEWLLAAVDYGSIEDLTVKK